MYEQGGLLAIDIDEMGVRPSDWNEDIKDYDNAMNDFYGSEKTTDITVYSAEIQIINNGKKLTTDENDSSMQDDEDSNDYDVDPETGTLKSFFFAKLKASFFLLNTKIKWCYHLS